MAQNILNIHGKVLPRRSVRRLTQAELHSPAEISKRDEFDKAITAKLSNSLSLPLSPEVASPGDFDSR